MFEALINKRRLAGARCAIDHIDDRLLLSLRVIFEAVHLHVTGVTKTAQVVCVVRIPAVTQWLDVMDLGRRCVSPPAQAVLAYRVLFDICVPDCRPLF